MSRFREAARDTLITTAVIGAFLGGAYKGFQYLNTYNGDPGNYDGFGKYEDRGLYPQHATVPTKLDVTRVQLLRGTRYEENVLDDGCLEVTGRMRYNVIGVSRDNPRFSLDDEAYFNTDIRPAKVVLCPQD